MALSSYTNEVALYSAVGQKNRVRDGYNFQSRTIIMQRKTFKTKKGVEVKGYVGYISLDNGQSIRVFFKEGKDGKPYKAKDGTEFYYADVTLYHAGSKDSSESRFKSGR